jgi:hypothetical protein
MIVKHLELKNQSYRNIKLNGISINCFLNGLANAGSTSVDFSKSTIQLILIRGGKSHVIYSGNLKVVGLASSVDTLDQLAFATTVASANQLVAGQQSMISFHIPFGGPVDLHNDDEIYIEIQNNANLFTNAALEASSYLEVKPLKCYGVERFIPQIRTWVIQENEQSMQYMIGDNLYRLVVLNYDKTDYTQNIINNLIFTSDRLDETYTFADLISRKLRSYGKQLIPFANADTALNIQEDQSFLVTDFDAEYDGVQLDMQFNGLNVTRSNNYIVAWTYYTDWNIQNLAAAKDAKHQEITNDKISAATVNKK